jgi:hypothetical protein
VLPEGIGNITSLHTLNWFDVGNKTYAEITVLGNLTSLTDLKISNHTMGPLGLKEAHVLAVWPPPLENSKASDTSTSMAGMKLRTTSS